MPFDDTDDDRNTWIDRELANALDTFLDDVVDVEAGLAAILAQARHDEATDALDGITDVEAGLAAILTPRTAPVRIEDIRSTARRLEELQLTRKEHLDRSRSDARRLRLRRELTVAPLYRAFERAVAIRAQWHHVDDFGVRIINARVLQREAEFVAADLERALERECPDPGSVRLGQDAALRLADGLRDLRLALSSEAFAELGPVEKQMERLMARCLVALNASVAEYCERHNWDYVYTAGEVLRPGAGDRLRSPQEVDWFFNDFTESDLTRVTVHIKDLEGVRWSKTGTRWPPGLDTADLAARSEETAHGSGVYVVLPGPAHVMA